MHVSNLLSPSLHGPKEHCRHSRWDPNYQLIYGFQYQFFRLLYFRGEKTFIWFLCSLFSIDPKLCYRKYLYSYLIMLEVQTQLVFSPSIRITASRCNIGLLHSFHVLCVVIFTLALCKGISLIPIRKLNQNGAVVFYSKTFCKFILKQSPDYCFSVFPTLFLSTSLF